MHENVKLMLNGCQFTELLPAVGCEEPGGIPTSRSLLDSLIRQYPTEKCYNRSCEDCPDGSDLSELFVERLKQRGNTEITYKQWTTTDRCTTIDKSDSVEQFTGILFKSLNKLVWHHNVAQQQSQHLRDVKNDLKAGELVVVMDFSENYAFVVQRPAQAFHWNNKQATIFPVVVYYKESDELKAVSFTGISDCNKHDTISAYMFQCELVAFLKVKFGEVNKFFYFTDETPSQFKNLKSFSNLAHHFEDFEIEAKWHYSLLMARDRVMESVTR
ncbi:uncharacterized protein LOC107045064 [Diachasma alloeum]|uniref:uncharacterized protein LOC107045064 n=1 Tax=Diachasma alloeum TaxID=454923 RepID=UPI00073843CB|nr:uncharacterized protein LOC107045064 [Diachasma alloeum]